ncbi:MAG TPA: glycosyltransferase [Steroidobacteraceae bacterium]|nr:glycosyltransferase [Steroidobacteraceae bacterium]
MAKTEIYQIFYSPESRAGLDAGFIPLDNLSNERPDWREYWPIRRFLLGRTLEADTYYGFFSAKFGAKTGLDSARVHNLIDSHGADADVVAFSPFFDHAALFTNIIEQAVACHGFPDTFRQCAQLIAPQFKPERSVMTSLDTIFSNFFVARREFWTEWLRQGERLFEIAEDGSTPLARALNTIVPYAVPKSTDGQTVSRHNVPGVPAKVFMIERLASLLLWSHRRWRVKSFSYPTLSGTVKYPDLLVLDALKIAYVQSGAEPYLETFRRLCAGAASRYLISPGQPLATPCPDVAVAAAAGASSGPPAAEPRGAAPEKIRIVCATRKSHEEFATQTALGRSLSLSAPAGVELRLFAANREGLPHVYNIALDESRNSPAILLFVHDDVYLGDFFWAERLREGLDRFDIVGVVGNRRRAPRQPSWFFSAFDCARDILTRDNRENFSGSVGYGPGCQPEGIDAFGPSGQKVKLLDGLFLAARSSRLWEKSVRFDDRFQFHLYDLDFCRQAERAGLAMGTWPISVIHGSKGSFGGEDWHRSYARYVDKWGD